VQHKDMKIQTRMQAGTHARGTNWTVNTTGIQGIINTNSRPSVKLHYALATKGNQKLIILILILLLSTACICQSIVRPRVS